MAPGAELRAGTARGQTGFVGDDYRWLGGRPGQRPGPQRARHLYGPLEAWFERSWKPGDIERVNRASSRTGHVC